MPGWMVYTIGLELIVDLALVAVWLLGGVTIRGGRVGIATTAKSKA